MTYGLKKTATHTDGWTDNPPPFSPVGTHGSSFSPPRVQPGGYIRFALSVRLSVRQSVCHTTSPTFLGYASRYQAESR